MATTTDVTLDVALPVSVAGTLCLPPGTAAPKAVQLLVHGGTYDGNGYWDFALDAERHSYVRAANAAGYATMVVDRVGYGDSTRPPSALLTGSAQANVVHQVVTELRSGQIGGRPWDKVILVGHSIGSGIAVMEASTYRDVDAVVLTGMTHHISPTSTTRAFLQYLHPAFLDPAFTGRGYDPGYLTSVPGKRAEFFYSPRDADPAVVAYDEATKDVVSATEVSDIVAIGFTGPVSLNIDVPVLMAVGGMDGIFCRGVGASDCSSAAALKTQELAYFAPSACLQTYVLPNAGHDLELSVNAQEYRPHVLRWADSVVSRAPGSGCADEPSEVGSPNP